MDLIMRDVSRAAQRMAIRREMADIKARNADKLARAKAWLGSMYVMHPLYDPELHPEHKPTFCDGSHVLRSWTRRREMGVL